MKRTLVALAAASVMASLALYAPVFAADDSKVDQAVKPAGQSAVTNPSTGTKPQAGKPKPAGVNKPAANKPASNKPAASKPMANKPAANKTVPNKPAAGQDNTAPSSAKPAGDAATQPKQ